VRESIGTNQGRSADLRADSRLTIEGKQLAIAPHISRAGRELGPADSGLDAVVVVSDFERSGVVRAEEVGGLRVQLAANAALQTQDEVVTRHGNTPVGRNSVLSTG